MTKVDATKDTWIDLTEVNGVIQSTRSDDTKLLLVYLRGSSKALEILDSKRNRKLLMIDDVE